MGKLLAQLAHHFLPNDFCRHKTQTAVGELIFVVPEFAFRQTLYQGVFQRLQVLLPQRRYRHDRIKGITLTESLDMWQQLGLVVQAVYLVDDQQHRHLRVLWQQ